MATKKGAGGKAGRSPEHDLHRAAVDLQSAINGYLVRVMSELRGGAHAEPSPDLRKAVERWCDEVIRKKPGEYLARQLARVAWDVARAKGSRTIVSALVANAAGVRGDGVLPVIPINASGFYDYDDEAAVEAVDAVVDELLGAAGGGAKKGKGRRADPRALAAHAYGILARDSAASVKPRGDASSNDEIDRLMAATEHDSRDAMLYGAF